MRRVLKAWFPAVVLTYVVASVLTTVSVLGHLNTMGAPVSATHYFSVSWHDLLGLSSSYLPLIIIAFVLALPVAAGLTRLWPAQRLLLFTLAGFVAIVALHMTMKAVLGVTGIAAARTMGGLMLQGLAGAAGGYLYGRLSARASV